MNSFDLYTGIKFLPLAAVLAAACGGTAPENACATPNTVVTCTEQNFYTFELTNDGPSWNGSQCRTRPCKTGDACEVQNTDGTFTEGVCR